MLSSTGLRDYYNIPAIQIIKPKENGHGAPSMKQVIDDLNQANFCNRDKDQGYRLNSKITPDNFELIDFGRVKYDKKVAIVYNPVSGVKYNYRDLIKNKLNQNHIKFDILET